MSDFYEGRGKGESTGRECMKVQRRGGRRRRPTATACEYHGLPLPTLSYILSEARVGVGNGVGNGV